MKRFFKKKQLMMVALVAALGVAVYLNYYMSSDPGLSADTPVEPPATEEHLGDATFVGAGVSDPEGTDSTKPTQPEQVNFFDQARDNRTTAREEALGIIQEVMDSAKSTAEDKKTASARATAIAQNVLQESNIENLILAKGFADSVVYIDGDNCSVVVQAEELQPQESLQILEIVVSQSAVAADKVQILAAKS